MKIKEVISYLATLAPPSLQESYDNAGLLIGDPGKEIHSALICLDLTEEVMQEAVENNCGLIISHHPLIFGGLKRINGKNAVERITIRAIKEDIAVYAIHTNLDNVLAGVNGILCDKLGIVDYKILQPLKGRLNKLVTFCPTSHAEDVRSALFAAGAGHIGNYDSCSFNLEGNGTFRAGEGSDPFVGNIGEIHTEKEVRVEVIFPDYVQDNLLTALKDKHPYEEVAYDIYPLGNEFEQAGAGMIGVLPKAMDETDFLKYVKGILKTGSLRHSPLTGKKIKTVALCGGSGSFLLGKAASHGADAFITGDMKYHQFFEGEGRMLLIDAGHYETEQFTKELLYSVLNEKFPTFALRISHSNTNAVHYY